MFDHIIPHNTPLSSPSVTAGNSAWHRKLVRQGSEPIQPPTQTCSKVRFFLSLLISADRGMMVCRTWVHSQTKYCNRAPYASQLGRMPSPKLLLYHTVRLPCSRRVTAYLSVTSTASTGSLIKEYEVVDFNPIQSNRRWLLCIFWHNTISVNRCFLWHHLVVEYGSQNVIKFEEKVIKLKISIEIRQDSNI